MVNDQLMLRRVSFSVAVLGAVWLRIPPSWFLHLSPRIFAHLVHAWLALGRINGTIAFATILAAIYAMLPPRRKQKRAETGSASAPFLIVSLCCFSAFGWFVQSGAYPQGSATNGGFPQGSGGGIPQDAFYVTTVCGGKTNCLQWVDDDSTDNCGAATTNFLTAVNTYAGPGSPQVFVEGSGIGKAYKLATAGCHLEFDIPTTVHHFATLDCAQPATTANCIQLSPSNLVASGPKREFVIDGGGSLVGGANLSNAGIEVEPFTVNSLITKLNFTNFGAGNATQGNCTNYAILYDALVFESTASFNHWQITDSTAGRCAFANPNGSVQGQNTVYFVNNTFGGQNATTCSSQAIIDGGSYGMVRDNNIFGWGVPIRVQGVGHRIDGNTIDTSNCSAHSVRAEIQYGAASSSTAVGPITIVNNQVDFYTNSALYLFAQAGDSTATIQGVAIIGNMAGDILNGGTESGQLFPSGTSCTNDATLGTQCYEYANSSMTAYVACQATSTAAGWTVGNIMAGCSSSTAGANIGTTNLYTPTTLTAVNVSCRIILTTAATTSSTLPQCVISYTDFFTNAVQTITVTPVWTSGTVGCSGSTTNTVGNSCQGNTGVIIPKNGTAVTYSTTNWASSGATAMVAQAFVRATTQ